MVDEADHVYLIPTRMEMIISGVRLKLDSATNPDAPPARDSIVVTQDRGRQPARLIEFQ